MQINAAKDHGYHYDKLHRLGRMQSYVSESHENKRWEPAEIMILMQAGSSLQPREHLRGTLDEGLALPACINNVRRNT